AWSCSAWPQGLNLPRGYGVEAMPILHAAYLAWPRGYAVEAQDRLPLGLRAPSRTWQQTFGQPFRRYAGSRIGSVHPAPQQSLSGEENRPCWWRALNPQSDSSHLSRLALPVQTTTLQLQPCWQTPICT